MRLAIAFIVVGALVALGGVVELVPPIPAVWEGLVIACFGLAGLVGELDAKHEREAAEQAAQARRAAGEPRRSRR